MITAGIDAGSRALKIVLFDSDSASVTGSIITAQGSAQAEIVNTSFREVIAAANLDREDVAAVVATGYGRKLVSFANTTITEITCHARGVHHLLPSARTVVEIGGQDSKVLQLDEDGSVRDFAMNDRCASGTGRFLEMVASQLEISLSDLGNLAKECTTPANISSTCVVFAETEIIGLLAAGTPGADIVAGVEKAIAQRVATMTGKEAHEPVAFTGGVALIEGMPEALSSALNMTVTPLAMPQLTGAIGAAILAAEKYDT